MIEAARKQLAYARPLCRLVVNGTDITAAVEKRLVELTLTDNRGMEADQLDVALSDHDGKLAIPPRGAELRLWLGWSDSGLVDKGVFTVDELEHSGAPDTLSIRARSADLRGDLKTRREQSWHATTLGAVLTAIAARHNLTPQVEASLAAVPIAHLDQANESDANLLTRLGHEHDAIAAIKAGRLLFMPVGGASTASGLALPHVTLTREDGDQHRYLEADRDSYSGVRAYYYNPGSTQKQEAIAGADGNLKDLRHSYADRDAALSASRAEWTRLQRGTATLSYTLAKGRPDLVPDQTFSLTGVKDEIGALIWLGRSLTHSYRPEAYTTSLELESQLPDEQIADLLDSGEGYTGVRAYYRDTGGQQKYETAGRGGNVLRLKQLYSGQAAARRAVEREWGRIQSSAPE